jgi:GntR family transcriptional regulator
MAGGPENPTPTIPEGDASTVRNSFAASPTKKELIVETLAAEIEKGKLTPGTRLVGEKTLASKFNASRGTVRQALSELQRRRLIQTRGGIGSVVTYDGYAIDQAEGWTASLYDIAADVTTHVLSIRIVQRQAVPELPEEVQGQNFVLVERRRDAQGDSGDYRAVSLERAYVRAIGQMALLPTKGLQGGSLTASLASAGLTGSRGQQIVSLHRIDRGEAALLELPPGTALLRTVRTSFNTAGRFVEHVVSLLDPEHFTVRSRFGDR